MTEIRLTMKKLYLFSTLSILLVAVFMFTQSSRLQKSEIEGMRFSGEAEEAGLRAAWEMKRLVDPATGKIPSHARAGELEFAKSLPQFIPANNPFARIGTPFNYRGPVNMGGRTRGLAVDVNDENIVLAGSVNGGIWRSTNGGMNWSRAWSLATNLAITWIAQDKRPGFTNEWYCTTGEPIGASSSANGGGGYYLGNGIYKSTDNGLTWNVLSNTSSGTPHSFDNVLDLMYKIDIDDHDSTVAILYAACYGAIYRSSNGGGTWSIQKGNASGSNFSYYTDVEVTSNGIAYATLSSDGPQKGIWRREINGIWSSISPPGWDTGTVDRAVLASVPMNENQIYVLAATPNKGKLTTNYKGDPEWTSLWKYTYLSGNGTGAGGLWEDLSANIPYDGSTFGNFNSQGGYNLMIQVHPNDTNVIFIGGTNLYRSTDGFTTSNNTTAIGGYDITSTLPHYVNYPNNHSDQHNLLFLPSNPSVAYQANDGGVYMTTDIFATPVIWQDLNNGYNTAQFYTVALDHGTPGSDIVMGGTQDNGTWWTNTQNAATPWTQPGRGDGGFCAIDNGHNFYYTSRQLGKLMKSTLDANGNTIAFNRIDPISPDSVIYQFINPFVLDPNNNDILYWAADYRIYRNDSLSSIPLSGNWDTISTGWFVMPDSVSYANAYVSAFGISTNPQNRLYVGTERQHLYRIDNANGPNPVMNEITDAVNFPSSGYINCIAVDPNNADHVIVVFSNYQIYSLFYSNDGGSTWIKGAGNLEGSNGVGPSLRWVTIVPTANGNVYLLGTSIGLFTTNTLNNTSTVWTQIAVNEIGNLVVDMMDVRTSDGYVIIGTHGGGMFSTTITDTILTGTGKHQDAITGISVYPNPAQGQLQISCEGIVGTINITIYDNSGRIVDHIQENQKAAKNIFYDSSQLNSGVYYVRFENEGKVMLKKFVVL